jgi:ankyrin
MIKPLTVILAVVVAAPAYSQTVVELVEAQRFDEALTQIAAGADVNAPSVDGTTALHWAAYFGNTEVAARLLRAEADPDTRNEYGSSPMGEAATVANVEMLELLLDAGADVESPNPEGQTALMAVARTGNIAAARLLLRHGADVNATENWGGQTALMWAAARQHPEMVEFLIENGAEVDKRAIDRNWERRVTAEPRVKEMLTGGFTPLLYAVREDCLDCVKKLLDAGADINKPDPDNVSPLVLALLNMRYDVARYLIEQGADVNQWDYWGRTPLYAAADMNILPASARGDLPPLEEVTGLDIARLLLEKGADPDYGLKLPPPPRNIVFDRAGDNGVMTTGSTPLQRAAYGCDIEMMQLLLDHGADLQLASFNGVTPMIALTNPGGSRNRNKSEESVMQGLAVLIEAGADINQRGGNFDETPLHTTARLNWQTVVKFLVEQGADLSARDNRGLIPLDYATGKADTQSLGNFNVVGELPEMAALLRQLMGVTDDGTADSTQN